MNPHARQSSIGRSTAGQAFLAPKCNKLLPRAPHPHHGLQELLHNQTLGGAPRTRAWPGRAELIGRQRQRPSRFENVTSSEAQPLAQHHAIVCHRVEASAGPPRSSLSRQAPLPAPTISRCSILTAGRLERSRTQQPRHGDPLPSRLPVPPTHLPHTPSATSSACPDPRDRLPAMGPAPTTPRRTPKSRSRARPKVPPSATASRTRRPASDVPVTEPPPKRRRYIPGGPGGGGRFIDEDGVETPADLVGTATTAPRPRALASNLPAASPSVFPQRERSTRIRTAVNRDKLDDMQYSSAAAVAAAVVQSEGYKPREERGWEEFHPNLDIDGKFMILDADEVDGISKPAPLVGAGHSPRPSLHGGATPTKELSQASLNALNTTPSGHSKPSFAASAMDTPSRRRLARPTRDSASLYATRPLDLGLTPKTPKVLPIHNQTPKERLDLKQPSYRKTDRIALFESKTFGQARYVDKSMMNVGYQESDNFIRPDRKLIKSADANVEEDHDQTVIIKPDGEPVQHPAGVVGRVEYDMDEQDDMWLETLNSQRKASELDPITREIFEITITKIEKEWHALEKRIPKPNPKPPQTHRPRSSSAAAVNGEPQAGEEQDSKCAICDDGDCENTNAIVFCDGCDLAVHQECYGVPFIPEGQWLCRKCQLIGRGVPVSRHPAVASPFLSFFCCVAELTGLLDVHFLPQH